MHIFGLNSQILIVSSELVQAHNSPPPWRKANCNTGTKWTVCVYKATPQQRPPLCTIIMAQTLLSKIYDVSNKVIPLLDTLFQSLWYRRWLVVHPGSVWAVWVARWIAGERGRGFPWCTVQCVMMSSLHHLRYSHWQKYTRIWVAIWESYQVVKEIHNGT